MLAEFLTNLAHNLFKPLLLFFYAGFLIPVLGVKFEYPKALYRSLVVYLLLAIGWHGGEELASLSPGLIGHALGFMVLGFFTNLTIGVIAYFTLRAITKLRQVDAATVAGYYGSDSAGTFVTCVGVLGAAQIAYAPYMPVLLAVMEIPGCLVALCLVSRMRQNGMDAAGNMPGEAGYSSQIQVSVATLAEPETEEFDLEESDPVPESFQSEMDGDELVVFKNERELVGAGSHTSRSGFTRNGSGHSHQQQSRGYGGYDPGAENDEDDASEPSQRHEAPSPELQDVLADVHQRFGTVKAVPVPREVPAAQVALAPVATAQQASQKHTSKAELLKEVFLNPGLYLLFAGLGIGFISRLQGESVVAQGDKLFITLFQGVLCLFLLEMGMMAAEKLRDLRAAGWQFIAFGLLAPNVFAMLGIAGVHAYSWLLGTPFDLGTYVLFSVLCAAASYIALPAVQTLAIPEASPTLPLAASLGLTFTYNVTIGIQVYIVITKNLMAWCPIGS